ncbi:MAG: hypothetical protein J5964_00940 [Eubacterium sp.]|nr:hypothetical protein [Eubacterium sp.]
MDENEKIVKKYKLLRHKIIIHYHRGCKYLNIAKVITAIAFLIFTAVGISVSHRTGNLMTWLLWWVIVIILDCVVFIITDYCKYLMKTKVIPYLENDDLLDFGEYDLFIENDEDEDEEEEEEQ